MGLSTCHISPPYHGISLKPLWYADSYENGQYLEVSVDKQENSVKSWNGVIRSRIKDFSSKSRHRLFKKVAKLNRETTAAPLFLTLTYPNHFPTDADTYKSHLDAFAKRFARKYPDGFFFWKLEFQRRGAPHYHLMVFGLDKVDIGWVSQSWYEIVGSADEKHLRAGTQVQKSRGWKSVLAYCGKYMGKKSFPVPDDIKKDFQVEEKVIDGQTWVSFQLLDEIEYVGRFWGLRQANNYLEKVNRDRAVLSYGAFISAKRVIRKWLNRQTKRKIYTMRNESLSAFLDYASAKKLIDFLA